jgi:hypothetical protein
MQHLDVYLDYSQGRYDQYNHVVSDLDMRHH